MNQNGKPEKYGKNYNMLAIILIIVGGLLAILDVGESVWVIGIICELIGCGIGIWNGIRVKKSRKNEDNEIKKW